MKYLRNYSLIVMLGLVSFSCKKDDDAEDTVVHCEDGTSELHAAFEDFDSDNVTITNNGTCVTIESNGLPNHTSPYWSASHDLYVEPTVTSESEMAPGNIDDFNGSYSLTVSSTPERADESTSTGLGAIGIAVSGSMIYNDEEGPNVPLDNAVGSLDYTAAHTGPQSYHYHLEPKAWSNDDEALIAIMADGFFLYGRKCNSTGSHPDDLDESGGHTSKTQHSDEAEYHYHVKDELYLDKYYILFPGDYQGTPGTIQ